MPKPLKAILLLATTIITSCDRRDASWSPEGKPIGEIVFEFVGKKTIHEDRLKSFIQSAAGSNYTAEVADDDIRSLYESGLVDDIRVLAEPADDNVRLVFEITPRPSFGPRLFIGNTAFSGPRLAREIGIDQETSAEILSPERFDTIAATIEAFYRANSYPKATVRVTSFDGGPPTEEDFQFVIEEGEQQSPE